MLTDQTGREVSLPAPPRRIVSLVPSVTEVLFTIAAQDRLAGVTDFCDYPPEARRKPRVGGMLAPNLETIITLKPDLVIATTAGNREETFVQLGRLRIPVYLVNSTTMGDVLDLISRLGALTEHPVPAARFVTALDTSIRMLVGRVAPLGRPRVLYVLWPEPVIVPGRGALVFEPEKRTRQSRCVSAWPVPGRSLVGYELHHGRSSGAGGGEPLLPGAGAEMGWRQGRAVGCICTGSSPRTNGARRSSTWSDRIAGVPFSRSDPPIPSTSASTAGRQHLRRSFRADAWSRLLSMVKGSSTPGPPTNRKTANDVQAKRVQSQYCCGYVT